jgi:carbon-monoxide dehydrogenase large subunit
MLHAVFVRSPYAHARVLSVDAAAARAMPGVTAVFVGAEIGAQPLQIPAEIPGYARPLFDALATDRVRHVGDPLAIVVARSRALAEDAAEAVLADYDPLAADAVLFDDAGTNLLFHSVASHGDVDGAFAAAHHVVRETFVQQRVTNVPMEGRGGIAEFADGELTYTASTQAPHSVRMLLAAALDLPAERIRVVTPDIGGGFGQKIPLSREEIAVCAASRALEQPVKWSEDRVENLTSGGHAREETVEAELALLDDGSILGMRVSMTLDHGAYPVLPVPAPAYTESVHVMLPGGYRVPALAFEARIVATPKASYVPYRGPWAVECLVREALLDRAAEELGLDPLAIRRRNLVPTDEQPVKLVTGPTLERMTALDTLERAAELVADEPRGPLRGVGFAVLVEPAPGPPDYSEAVGFGLLKEPARARLEADGRVTLMTAQAPHGQSHETTLGQLAADTFGVALDRVTVLHGDTNVAPFFLLGTGGSRAATMASGAAIAAVAKLRAHVLETTGTDDLDEALAQLRGGTLEVSAEYTQPGGGWTCATHVCVVEIDGETGLVHIPRYVVVEDCGRMINPAIVDGQIRGGVVQGLGQALLEHAAYDEDGQFLAATFMDYLLPTSTDAPTIEIEHLEIPDLDEHDFRGVGEGGTIAAPAAVVNAVASALGVAVTRLPLDPSTVLDLVDAASASAGRR